MADMPVRMSAGCGDDRGAVAQALVGVKLRFRWRTACGVLWCGVLWGVVLPLGLCSKRPLKRVADDRFDGVGG